MRRFNQLLAYDDGKSIIGQLDRTIKTVTTRGTVAHGYPRQTGRVITRSEADLGTITRILALPRKTEHAT
jgi:hypothetical protein